MGAFDFHLPPALRQEHVLWAYNSWLAWADGTCLCGSREGPDPCCPLHSLLKLLFCISERSQQGPCSPQGHQHPDGGWGRAREAPGFTESSHQLSSLVDLSHLSGGWEWGATEADPFWISGPPRI